VVLFNLGNSGLSVRVPGCQKLQMTVSHRTLYRCSHMATVGAKGLNWCRLLIGCSLVLSCQGPALGSMSTFLCVQPSACFLVRFSDDSERFGKRTRLVKTEAVVALWALPGYEYSYSL